MRNPQQRLGARIGTDEREEVVVGTELHVHLDDAVSRADFHPLELQLAVDEDPNIAAAFVGQCAALHRPRRPRRGTGPAASWDMPYAWPRY